MANPEQRPQSIPAPYAEPVPLPQQGRLIVSDTEHQVILEKTNGMLSVQVSRNDRPVFSAALTPENRVHLVFEGGSVGSPFDAASTALARETKQALEHPPITVEGYPVRPGKYQKDAQTGKRTYSLTIAHHPNPDNRKEVVYYDLVAEDEKADECYAARVLDTRKPVHVTGDDLSIVKKKKDGGERTEYKVRIDSLEKIEERRADSPHILREKVKLSDLEQ